MVLEGAALTSLWRNWPSSRHGRDGCCRSLMTSSGGTTSFALTAGSFPWNEGARRTPAAVFSMKVASQTSVGSTQCAARTSGPGGGGSNGHPRCLIDSSRFRRSRASASVKPVPTSAGVHESRAVVVSDDQGTEPVLPAFLIGEASDHEQTTLKTLDLPPAVASPRLIRQVTPLGDDLLDTHPACLVEDPLPRASTCSV